MPSMESWGKNFYFTSIFGGITNIGFEINPYYPCVTNKIFNIKKMNVMCRVDYLKVGHDRNNIVIRVSKWLDEIYERLFEYLSVKINIYRVKTHK